ILSLEDGFELAVERARLTGDSRSADTPAIALREVADRVACRPEAVRFVSTVTGGPVAPDAEHWAQQATGAHRLAEALSSAACGPTAFVEIGPGAELIDHGRRVPGAPAAAWLPSLAACP